MRMHRTPPFSPQIGEKPYLEELSRFRLWRDFLNNNIQATISAFKLVKNCQLIPNQWNFTSATLNHTRHTFSPFKNFCKLAHHAETVQYEKYVWEKSNGAHSLSIRVQTMLNHTSVLCFCFLPQYQRQRARAEKGIARHIDSTSVVGTW